MILRRPWFPQLAALVFLVLTGWLVYAIKPDGSPGAAAADPAGPAPGMGPQEDRWRREAEALLDQCLHLLMEAPSPRQPDIIEACIELNDQWLRHDQASDSDKARLLDRLRALVAQAPRPASLATKSALKGRLLEGGSRRLFPGRVQVLGSDGIYRHARAFAGNATLSNKPVLPLVFGGINASYTLPFFYSDGTFEIDVPPGRTVVTLERGFEHPVVSQTLDLQPGELREITLHSSRFLEMKALGWISGDTHIHWAKNHWSENEDIQLLRLVQRAEDLCVANNLTLKHHTGPQNFIAPTQFPMGAIPGLCDDDYHAQMAEEYRNEEFYGHIILLNIKRLIEPVSTGSMGGPPHFWDWPPNTHAIREARAQGGLSIEAHGLGANNDVPVNIAQGLTDSIDQIAPEDYYRFLDCGFRLPLSNGSDHPARVAGVCRVYVRTAAPFTYQAWCDGLKAGRTFTTSGPLLFLTVNGHDIGDVLDVPADTVLKIHARAASRHPIGVFQLVSNGEVIAEVKTPDREAVLSLDLPAGQPRWIVARASQSSSFNALDAPHIAHTSAIYVNVGQGGGGSRFHPPAAREWIRRMEIHAADMEKRGRFPGADQRAEAVNHVRSGIRVFQQLLDTSGAAPVTRRPPPQPVPPADLAAEGWYAGDLHVHRGPEEMPALMRESGLHVASVITWWNDANPWRRHPLPEVTPTPCDDGRRFFHLLGGEDERDGGALLFHNLPQPIDITGSTKHWPLSLDFLRAAKAAGAWCDIEKPFWKDVPLWLASGAVDSIGICHNHMQTGGVLGNEAWGRPRDTSRFAGPHGNGLYSQELYYHILNCGFRLPPTAGGASGVLPNPVGYNRVYVHCQPEFSWNAWWAGLKAGRAFVTNGPLLRVQANGRLPGHAFTGGAPMRLELTGSVDSRDPISRLELVVNGRTTPITLPHAFEMTASGWFLVRALTDVPHTFRFASTAPWYVDIAGHSFEPAAASTELMLDWTRQRRAEVRQALRSDPRRHSLADETWNEAEEFWLRRGQRENR